MNHPDNPRPTIGIDLGGTNIKAALIDLRDGRVLEQHSRATRDRQFDDAGVPLFAHGVRELVQQLAPPGGVAAVGLSSPGLAVPELTHIHSMPNKMIGIEGFMWRDFLDLPASTGFAILNDAHAALLGEAWLGAARGVDEVALYTLGTGVGGAILSRGKLLLGRTGRAGHLGHVSLDPWGKPSIAGTPGALEDFIGNQTVSQRSEGRFPDTASLVAAVEQGDQDAAAIWKCSTDALGAALVSTINAFDPELIVIGGGIARAGETLMRPLREFLDRHEWRFGEHRVRLALATLGETAGTFGAAKLASERSLSDS